ncbi:hypothetical protein ACHQM5_007728 [Ranunculus cassubicifolius]
MAAFPYQKSTSVCDSILLGNTSNLDGADINHSFSTYPPPPQFLQEYFHHIDVTTYTSEKSKSSNSSSMVLEQLDRCDDHNVTLLDMKRNKKDDYCLSSAQSQDMRVRKQRKCSKRKEETVEKKSKSLKKDEKKVVEEPPTGYIHVRARRGQATDSHSLAERVRREKISERMKLLQSLVPGCDKVTGKALMLDEIINYVQSLQYQVEFLSMKLASASPVLHDCGADINALMVKAESLSSLASALPSIHPPPSFADMMETPTTRNNYSLEDNAVSFLQQQGHQMPTAFPQDKENLLWDVYDDSSNMGSFQ